MSNVLKTLSAIGLVALALHEGFSSTPYKDSVGIWTNGFGNTHNAQVKVSVPQALDQLQKNTLSASGAVNTCIHVVIKQNEFDAYTSLAYNIGNTAFCNSTLVKKANVKDFAGACLEILRWDRAGGKRLAGLTARRQDEYKMCIGE